MCGSHHRLCWLQTTQGTNNSAVVRPRHDVCRAWGHSHSVTWAEQQSMGEGENNVKLHLLWERRLSFLSFCQISEDRPDVSSACLALIDTVHCWSPGPGAVPSATNIRWLCDHTRHQVTRDPTTKYTLTHKHKSLNIWTLEKAIFSHQNVSTNLHSPISDSRTVRLTLGASPPPVSL